MLTKIGLFKKISKFPHSRSASLRFALRDCGNRAQLPSGKCARFEISCAVIALLIGFFYSLIHLLYHKTIDNDVKF